MTAPKLRPPTSGWIEDLPEPSSKPTAPLALEGNAPNHLDDIYLEVPRISARARGIYFWMGIFMVIVGLLLLLLLLTDPSPFDPFEDFSIVAPEVLSITICGWLAAIFVRMDISIPRDLPLRFNCARQR
ncbi:hypothetical protein N7373_25985, partial [Achromobacter mucicolens]|uniref:hypothetical protein n=1 Tax=Achromobacter mucicolens TaxID=1389922 RepID=UPI0024520BBD|nr:hypothetical protein [Achromobacter mucicolens]